MAESVKARVVVVGGGFGGLYATRALCRAPARITLVDRKNHHLFQPLLYQVATAALNPSDIAAPIRSILRRQRNVTVLLGDVRSIDLSARRVDLADASLAYDYLVLATGATHSYFGHEDWAAHAPGLKTIEDALEVRRRVFLAFEAAERQEDARCRDEWMSFVIVGAGPTGVEMAGALAEIAHHDLVDDFRRIDPRMARIVLVEGLDRVLPGYPPRLSDNAREHLQGRGVEVRTGARVTRVHARGIEIGGEAILARTVVWAAGVAASCLGRTLGVDLDGAGRVRVAADLSIPGHPEAFVVGDLAAAEQDGGLVPGVSPAAIQGGVHAARTIMRAIEGRSSRPFRYVDKGSFAVIGRGAAVGDLAGRLQVHGLPAWVAWLAIHIYFLIGFRNRLLVLLNWAFAYLTLRRAVRLITGRALVSAGEECGSSDATRR